MLSQRVHSGAELSISPTTAAVALAALVANANQESRTPCGVASAAAVLTALGLRVGGVAGGSWMRALRPARG